MSTASTSAPMPPFPSFEERRKANQPVSLTTEAKRIFWRLQGSLSDNIFVVQDWRNMESPREPLAYQDSAGNITSWHPIAQAPLTEPKVGSITVKVDALEQWQCQWLECHERHADPDDEDTVFGDLDAELYWDSGDNSGDEDEGPELLRCCNTDRPRRAPRLVVKASSAEKGYVTVRDFVSAVHPWVLGMREDIVQADNVWDDKKPADYERLVISQLGVSCLQITDEERFLRLMSPRRRQEPAPVNAATASIIELMRQIPVQPFNYQNLYAVDPPDLPQGLQGRGWPE